MIKILRYKESSNKITNQEKQQNAELQELVNDLSGDESSNILPEEEVETVEDYVKYKITDNDTELSVYVNYKFRDEWHEKTFTYNKVDNIGNFIQVDCGRFTYGFDFLQYNVLDIIDNMFFKSRNQHSHETMFRILFDPNGDIIIALLKPYHEIEGFYNVEMDNTKTVLGAFVDNSEWFANKYALIRKKATLLNTTDVYKSVSYLEAQVDVLTRALLEVIDKNNTMYDVLKQADKYSVLDMKPVEDISKEFIENKANFRKMQEEYYSALHGKENSGNTSGK